MTPITPLPFMVNDPDVFIGSRSEIHIPGTYGLERMRRTGITPPGYPDHPVYRIVDINGNYKTPVFYVLSGGRFWDADKWRQYFKAHGDEPTQVGA